MVNSALHRVKYSGIDSKAFAIKRISVNSALSKVAVSRGDNSLEVWNLKNTPFVERFISPLPDSSIEGLAWCGNRLFSVGAPGVLVEYNLFHWSAQTVCHVTGATAWCLAVGEYLNKVAVGTDLGYVNIFDVSTQPTFEKLLLRKEGKVLCIVFDQKNEIICTGGVDTVRVYHSVTGWIIHEILIERKEKNVETVVWCIGLLQNYTFVTGDSRGVLSFWDAKNGILVEKYACHSADILCLTVNQDRNEVYCSGVDPVIFRYTNIIRKGSCNNWIKSNRRKVHEVDVLGIQLFNDTLLSGGLDGFLTLSKHMKPTIRCPPFGQLPIAVACEEARLLLIKGLNKVEVWSIKMNRKPVVCFKLVSRFKERIVCCGMTPNGKYLCYATARRTVFFNIDYPPDAVPILRKCKDVALELYPIHRFVFCKDSRHFVASFGKARLFFGEAINDVITVKHIVDCSKVFEDVVHVLEAPTLSKYVVASDVCGNVGIWVMKTGSFQCKLPKYEACPTAISIKGPIVYLAHADRKISEYNVKQQRVTAFSELLAPNHPQQWLSKPAIISGLHLYYANVSIIILSDYDTICVYNKLQQMPDQESEISSLIKCPSESSSSTSYSSSLSSNSDNSSSSSPAEVYPDPPAPTLALNVVKKFNKSYLLYVGWIGSEEMVAVESHHVDYVRDLEPSYVAKKPFGV